MKEISNKLNIHISTVSQAVKNKVFLFYNKKYNLKILFSNKLSNISTYNLKESLKNIINQENKKIPYTDLEISNIFKLKNITISRRTISKYRKDLNILDSSKRRLHL